MSKISNKQNRNGPLKKTAYLEHRVSEPSKVNLNHLRGISGGAKEFPLTV